MIVELAQINVTPGRTAEFEDAAARAVRDVLSRAEGYLNFQLRRCLDGPDRYSFEIRWRTLEDHTIGFRQSSLFGEWRAIIGEYFAEPPLVEHWVHVE